MSERAATDWTERLDSDARHAAPLNNQDIERILADFRQWLESAAERDWIAPDVEPFSMEGLVAQLTALRHEVNLQTKASRQLAEQAAQHLKKTDDLQTDDLPQPVIKALLEIADTLAFSAARMNELRQRLEKLAAVPEFPAPPRAGLFARLLGWERRQTGWRHQVEQHYRVLARQTEETARMLNEFAASAADGYLISGGRIKRLLAELGIEPIEVLGQPFDPNTMEAVALAEGPAGTVLEEIRRGYRRYGQVVRCAQVRVARDTVR